MKFTKEVILKKHLILAFALLLTIFPQAHAGRAVAPAYDYRLGIGSPELTNTIFATPEEAFAAYSAWLSSAVPNRRVVRFYIDVNSDTYNGIHSYYMADVEALIDGQWRYNNSIDLIWAHQVCPTTTYTYLQNIWGPPAYISSCINPSTVPPDPVCEDCKSRKVGNPIYPSTGVKLQTEVDYQGTGSNELNFVRTYRSDRHGWTTSYQAFGIDYAIPAPPLPVPPAACYPALQQYSLRPNCFKYLGKVANQNSNDVVVQRSGGRMLNFGTASDLSPELDVNDRVVRLAGPDGAFIGLSVYNSKEETTETYNTSGRLASITSRTGKTRSLTYSDENTPANIASTPGLLIKVSDHFGRQLNFTYDAQGRLATMTNPEGGVSTYAYDENTSIVLANNSPVNNLTSVTYPDGSRKVYWYNEQDKTAGNSLPYALTGISDELGNRFASFFYDSAERGLSTEHAGGVEKYSIAYVTPWVNTKVIDPLGASREYIFKTVLTASKNTQINLSGPGIVSSSSATTFDAQGNVSTITDFNGIRTTYSYDLTRNLEVSRIEGATTAAARTITTSWHANYRLPLRIAEPKRLTSYSYDSVGNLLTTSVQATSDSTGAAGFAAATVGTPRVWTNTYSAIGQLLTTVGPTNDTTTYSYDSQGNLATVVNAAGHTTTMSAYDASGRVGKVTDPNGLITNYIYTPRGWLANLTVGGLSWSYGYDGAGQLTSLTMPDNSVITYTYDPAHRLTRIDDSAGNSIVYTLDNMGNRINEVVKDPGGAMSRQVARTFDILNHLKQQTGGVQ